ncbi:leucine-rich repeat domain-containing protein [Flammeovirga sp. SJP92]|uniref:leucine-rich repeat domain-containing protein n=1 Tax=Flammeovirga sp. SJP92 TaxID=1775430 RepID=UPI000787EBE2|nr:leucine-rich repeat domain-containing protein [Flammeovirga sp. SJP92]KXX66916.1 hypothetical protein AVL50_29875 [Flammeovirga sp. SJP92]
MKQNHISIGTVQRKLTSAKYFYYFISSVVTILLVGCTNYKDMEEKEAFEKLYAKYNVEYYENDSNDEHLTMIVITGEPSLTEFPEEMQAFKKLQEIRFINCNVTEIPEFITEFPELKALWLEGNPIKVLPSFITKCRKLNILDLSNTEVSQFPEGFGNLPITSLYIEGSKIQGFPNELYQFDSLIHLYLNPINELPSDIGNFEKLKHLKVALKSFKYLDTIESIELLILNNSTGTHLPEGLGNLPYLKGLNLRYCKSLFKLPLSLGNLAFLSKLDLTGCTRITGLPSTLNQVRMRILKLDECNSLRSVPKGLQVGSIWAENVTWKSMPTGIFDSRAHDLNVINHQITDITGIGRMKNLINLDLSNGKIKRIPPDINQCTKLDLFILEGNEIENTYNAEISENVDTRLLGNPVFDREQIDE